MKKWLKIVILLISLALVVSTVTPALAQKEEEPPPFQLKEKIEKIGEIVTLNLDTAYLLAKKANELAKTGEIENLRKAGEMAKLSMEITSQASRIYWPWWAPGKWKEWSEKWKEWLKEEKELPELPEKPPVPEKSKRPWWRF